MSTKLLVIDDDPHVGVLMEAMLKSIGCQAEVISSGKAAIEILREPEKAKQYRGVFLDVFMPEMDGWDVLKTMREHSHNEALPVIMLTSDDASQAVMKAYQEGASYFIPKPLRREQIVKGLSLLLNPDREHGRGQHYIPENW